MSHTRFELILQHLKYTNINPPTYKDRFWEVCEMLEEWNKNMATNFVPSQINCIDESMSKWLNEYTCPGFMFVPQKPWPFGSEYHNAGCADSNIIWSLELKDRPPQLDNKPFDDLGKTVGTLLRLTKPVWGSGKVFILDSGICILKAIIELQKKGIFTAALIKNDIIGQNLFLEMPSFHISKVKKLVNQILCKERWMVSSSIWLR